MQSDLYKAVVDSYISTLMGHDCLLEIFLEQKRSRSGKIQKPTEPLFEHIVKLQLDSIASNN